MGGQVVKIELLFFAQIKEAFGADGETIDIGEGTTVNEVVGELRTRDQWKTVASIPLLYAVNEKIAGGTQVLRPGDRLALLTPISGG
jgi:molybdopterin converting factor small subunit